MKKKIEWFIFNAFSTSIITGAGFIPWEQGALLYRINILREKLGYKTIDNISLGRELSKLKKTGKVTRLRWFNPSTGNIWIWNDK